MSSQERPRPSKSSRETYTADDAYETGETTLDLDSVSNTDLDSLSFEEDADAYSPSLQTLSGLSLILAGLVYLVTEISASPVSALFHPDLILPWLLGTTVLLVGIALLTLPSPNNSEAEMPSTSPESPSADSSSPSRRLMRSRSDRKLFGICGGIATYLDVDPTLVRVGFVLGSVVFGPLILIYLGLAFAIPKEPAS